jgi:integrase
MGAQTARTGALPTGSGTGKAADVGRHGRAPEAAGAPFLEFTSEFLIDGRYGWAVACEQAFGPGRHPVAIAHEWNTIAHLNDYEGNPEARPFTRQELQRFLDYADEQVERAVGSKGKGALAAYRDAILFKVIYGWGLRRTETSKLDVVDFGRNPAAPEFGRFGMLNVRYGKAKKGQPPRALALSVPRRRNRPGDAVRSPRRRA